VERAGGGAVHDDPAEALQPPAAAGIEILVLRPLRVQRLFPPCRTAGPVLSAGGDGLDYH
jgi:hypothetical protein